MSALTQGTWRVVPEQSKARFLVSNLGLLKVSGYIEIKGGEVEVDAAGQPVGGVGILDLASISTGNAKRDADLRAPRLLDAVGHPELSYRALSVTADEQGWQVEGYLNVSGTDSPLTLRVTATPEGPEWTVRATGRLDRKDTRARKVPSFMIGRWIDVEVEARLVAARQPMPAR